MILPDTFVEVEVHAAVLSLPDLLTVLGVRTTGSVQLGSDFAGLVQRVGHAVGGVEVGQRVYGVTAGGVATHVRVRCEAVAEMPANLTFAEAANRRLLGTFRPVLGTCLHFALFRIPNNCL